MTVCAVGVILAMTFNITSHMMMRSNIKDVAEVGVRETKISMAIAASNIARMVKKEDPRYRAFQNSVV